MPPLIQHKNKSGRDHLPLNTLFPHPSVLYSLLAYVNAPFFVLGKIRPKVHAYVQLMRATTKQFIVASLTVRINMNDSIIKSIPYSLQEIPLISLCLAQSSHTRW